REGSALSGPVTQVAAARLAGSGWIDGRVVTAVRNGAGNLQVEVWDFHNDTDQVVKRDSFIAGAVSEVAVQTLHSSGSLAQSTRFVTAVRNASGNLQVDVWDVDGAGHLNRQGKATTGAVTATNYKNKLAIGRWEDDDFFTASIGSDGN